MYGPRPRFGRCASIIACIVFMSGCSTLDQVSGPEQAPSSPAFIAGQLSSSDSAQDQQGEDQQGSVAVPVPRGLDGSALIGSPLPSGSLSGLLACPAQPEWTDEEAIGPEGGVLRIGPHRLYIPAGALDSTVVITATAASDSAVSVLLQPEGLTFNVPARLTLDYSHCPLIASLLAKRIAYTTDDLDDVIQMLRSSDDLYHRKISASLDHFSRYAVAW
jgi:hypothetical protein